MAIISFTHTITVNAEAVRTHKGLVNLLHDAMIHGEGAYLEVVNKADGTVSITNFTNNNLKDFYAGGTFDRVQSWVSGALARQAGIDADDETDFMHWR